MVKQKNKKATIELSMSTIIILVLAMTMLILGLVLVRSIFDKDEFVITKEECSWEKEFSHWINVSNKIGQTPSLYINQSLECYFEREEVNPYSVPNVDTLYCKVFNSTEVCEQVEVDEDFTFEGKIGSVHINKGMWDYKKDFIFQVLDENCEPYKCIYDYDNSIDIDGDCQEGYNKILEYKCGDYNVRVS